MDRTAASSSTRATGLALIGISVLFFSMAGLFSKGIDAGAWEIIFWRAVFSALAMLGWLAWRRRIRAEFGSLGRTGWLAAAFCASGTAAFIPAFKLTSIANVTLIYAAAPILTGLAARFWFGERMTRPAILGCLAGFGGVAVIVAGSLGSLHLRGDLLALWMTLSMALVIALFRHYPATPGSAVMVLSCLFLLPPGAIFGSPLAVDPAELGWMALFGLSFATASVTLVEAAKRLPAGECALISTAEIPLAILLAFLILGEIPAIASLIGGGAILAGIAGSQIAALKRSRPVTGRVTG